MGDALFDHITAVQGDTPWGSVLDAGTGAHSLRFLMGLPSTGWTAITGDPVRAANLTREHGAAMRPGDRIIAGNWTDPTLLFGEGFDTVLADYLLGALDGFAPYFQDRLFSRLRPLVRGRLYVVGLQPYPDAAETPGGRLILEIARLRDACILLAGDRCYREYPLDWTLRHLEVAGFVIQDAARFPIRYAARFINGQLDVCTRKLPRFADPDLARQMASHIEALRARALAFADAAGGIAFGEDYVVTARPV